MRESHPSMATCAPYAPLKKRRHSAMKSPPPSSEHGIAHPVKTWPSSLVSRFPHFLKNSFTRFPHFSGYRAALFRPRDCIKRRFRRFYRLTVKRRAATRPACGMEVRLVPRRPSAASRQCPHLGDAGLWRACRPHPWSQWSARPILRQTPATYEHIFRKRLFSACHPLHSDTDIQWIAQRPSSPQFDRLYHYPSKAWSFGTLITGRVLRHFPPECRRQLPQSGLRSENVRFRNGPRRIPMVLVGFTKCCMLHSVQHLRIHRTTLIQQRTDFATWRHDNR